MPTIARLHGHVLGGALELVLACDLRVAAASCRLGMPEITVGIPSVIQAALLPGLIGWGRTAELLLGGRPVDAVEAERWGLVNRAVEEDALDREVQGWVDRLLALPPDALRLQKSLARALAPRGSGHRGRPLDGRVRPRVCHGRAAPGDAGLPRPAARRFPALRSLTRGRSAAARRPVGRPGPELHPVPARALGRPVHRRPRRRRDQDRAAGRHALGAELGRERPLSQRRQRLLPVHAPQPAEPDPRSEAPRRPGHRAPPRRGRGRPGPELPARSDGAPRARLGDGAGVEPAARLRLRLGVRRVEPLPRPAGAGPPPPGPLGPREHLRPRGAAADPRRHGRRRPARRDAPRDGGAGRAPRAGAHRPGSPRRGEHAAGGARSPARDRHVLPERRAARQEPDQPREHVPPRARTAATRRGTAGSSCRCRRSRRCRTRWTCRRSRRTRRSRTTSRPARRSPASSSP